MIKEDIQKAIITNLKAKNGTEVKVLRYLLSMIKYAEIDKHQELTDEEIQALFSKEIKKRKEAIEIFKKGKRDDLVSDEEEQVTLISKYLPQQLSDDQIRIYIEETIKEIHGQDNVGLVIGAVMQKVKGRADGSTVAGLVKERLRQGQ